MTATRSVTVLLVMFLSLCLSDCRTAPIIGDSLKHERLADGMYEGSYSSWPNKAAVKVTIEHNRITDIQITQYWASWIGRKAEPVIPLRIIDRQSTNVDAVSGATNSSRVIMNAVQNAIDRSYRSHDLLPEGMR